MPPFPPLLILTPPPFATGGTVSPHPSSSPPSSPPAPSPPFASSPPPSPAPPSPPPPPPPPPPPHRNLPCRRRPRRRRPRRRRRPPRRRRPRRRPRRRCRRHHHRCHHHHRLLVDEGRRRAELPNSWGFARGSSRLHLLFSGVTESSFVSYKMFNGTITPQAARSWPGQDVSREMVRLRDRERDLAGGRGPGPGARARAHGAPRRIFFSDLLHTCV